jgi:glucose/arabinose dehydrogenase
VLVATIYVFFLRCDYYVLVLLCSRKKKMIHGQWFSLLKRIMMLNKFPTFIARLIGSSLVLVAFNWQVVYAQTTPALVDTNFDVELVVDGLPKSWSINLSPGNEIFVTDRNGSVIVYDQQWNKKTFTTPITDLIVDSQGGFLDLAFHPDFDTNSWIYLSYSAGTSDSNRLKVVRFKMPNSGNEIKTVEDIFSVNTDKNTPVHYGGRLVFLADNSLLISTGDGFDFREQAQVKSSHLGKIIRVSDIGKALSDNPFFEKEMPNSNASYVYSLGHRNPQALLVGDSGLIISHEHGPAGGDEINIIKKGNNYGWPIITNGQDYSGAVITPFTEYPGMQQPDFDWTPSIAPSGMILYVSDKFPSLSQHLIVTSLKFKQLRALLLNGDKVSNERILLPNFEHRLRDIEQDSDGNILLLTDGDHTKIFKLTTK